MHDEISLPLSVILQVNLLGRRDNDVHLIVYGGKVCLAVPLCSKYHTSFIIDAVTRMGDLLTFLLNPSSSVYRLLSATHEDP